MGATPKYSTPEKMQERIDAYFESCTGEWLKGQDGRLVLDKHNRPVKINERVPTVTGLTLALGFATRKSLWDYQHKPAFRDTVTVAKSRVEAAMEARLFDRDGCNGARFALAAQFKWRQQPIEENTPQAATVRIIQEKSPPTPAVVQPEA